MEQVPAKDIPSIKAQPLDPLLFDLVDWIAREPRLYVDVIDAWRTSCPRLTVWEDAVDRGFVERRREACGDVVIAVTDEGRAFLKRLSHPVLAAAPAGPPTDLTR